MQKQGQSEHTGVLTNYAHVQMHVHAHSQTRPGDGTFTDTHGHMGLYGHSLMLCICIVFIFMISESHFVLLSPKLDIWEKIYEEIGSETCSFCIKVTQQNEGSSPRR